MAYISTRFIEGTDIYQIAKNYRTNVEMIEKDYASHIKDRLDASAINVMKRRRRPMKPWATLGVFIFSVHAWRQWVGFPMPETLYADLDDLTEIKGS